MNLPPECEIRHQFTEGKGGKIVIVIDQAHHINLRMMFLKGNNLLPESAPVHSMENGKGGKNYHLYCPSYHSSHKIQS